MKHLFVDCETDGLYGPFLSVAALVTGEQGDELDSFYGAIQPSLLAIQTPWVQENVVPYLSCAEVFFLNEEALLEAFWSFWMRWCGQVECVADVSYPIEARLFSRCVEWDLLHRAPFGPYPLLDLSTLLKARGLDPLADRHSLTDSELVPHDAMSDVMMMVELWNRLMRQ